MTLNLKNYFVGDSPITVDYSNFSISLNYGTGLGLSSGDLINTGVLSLQGDTGALTLTAGTGIGISGLTISNDGVTSLQGSTGALSLTAGTGIGISGLTITNDGVTSLTAGTGISLSGSTGGVTITNTGITSLTAGNGISISGSTIAMSGSYSGSFSVSGVLSTADYITIPYVDGSGDFVFGSGAWGGSDSGAFSGVMGIAELNDQNDLFTFSAGSSEGMSIQLDGAIFGGDGFSSLLSNADGWIFAGQGLTVGGWSLSQSDTLNVDGSASISGSLSAGSYNLSGGTGISFSGTTITNTGVTSLQGDTGALSLSAGTGISISGLTITNTGITSLSAGNGISVSGSTISMSGSYSGNLTVDGNITSQESPANVLVYNTGDPISSVIHDTYTTQYFGFYNPQTTTEDGIPSQYMHLYFAITNNGGSGEVGTMNMSEDGLSNQNPPSFRNTLDDGSGNMSVAGALSVSGNITADGSLYTDNNVYFTGQGGSCYIDKNMNFRFPDASGSDTWGIDDSSGSRVFSVGIESGSLSMSNRITSYNGVGTAGFGVPAIIYADGTSGYTGGGNFTIYSVSYSNDFAVKVGMFMYMNSFGSGASVPNLQIGTTDWYGNGHTEIAINGDNVGDDAFSVWDGTVACRGGDSVVVSMSGGNSDYNFDYFVVVERIY